jgi:hypothetical protein
MDEGRLALRQPAILFSVMGRARRVGARETVPDTIFLFRIGRKNQKPEREMAFPNRSARAGKFTQE